MNSHRPHHHGPHPATAMHQSPLGELDAAVAAPSPIHNRFEADKHAWEEAIRGYVGNDPLDLWFNYVTWYEQNRTYDRVNNLRPILEKCLAQYQETESYKQDIRLVKLWMKFIDMQAEPPSWYQMLYNKKIGTQCASFYISWAHYCIVAKAYKQADSIYNLGLQMNARPIEDLQEAQKNFRLSHAGRMLYNDTLSKKRSSSTLVEQRPQIISHSPPQKRLRHESAEYQSHPHQEPNVPSPNYISPAAERPSGAYEVNSNVYYPHHQQQQQQQQQQKHAGMPPQTQHSLHNTSVTSGGVDSAEQQYQQYQNHQHPQHHAEKHNGTYYHSNDRGQHEVQQLPPVRPSEPPATATQTPSKSSQSSTAPYHPQTAQQEQHVRPTAVSVTPSVAPSTDYSDDSIIECNLNNSAYVISSSLSYVYEDPDLQQYGQMEAQTAEQQGQAEGNGEASPICQPPRPPSDGLRLPEGFVRESYTNHETWDVPLCLEEPYDPERRCYYPKHLVYPDLHIDRPTMEFSLEEIRSRAPSMTPHSPYHHPHHHGHHHPTVIQGQHQSPVPQSPVQMHSPSPMHYPAQQHQYAHSQPTPYSPQAQGHYDGYNHQSYTAGHPAAQNHHRSYQPMATVSSFESNSPAHHAVVPQQARQPATHQYAMTPQTPPITPQTQPYAMPTNIDSKTITIKFKKEKSSTSNASNPFSPSTPYSAATAGSPPTGTDSSYGASDHQPLASTRKYAKQSKSISIEPGGGADEGEELSNDHDHRSRGGKTKANSSSTSKASRGAKHSKKSKPRRSSPIGIDLDATLVPEETRANGSNRMDDANLLLSLSHSGEKDDDSSLSLPSQASAGRTKRTKGSSSAKRSKSKRASGTSTKKRPPARRSVLYDEEEEEDDGTVGDEYSEEEEEHDGTDGMQDTFYSASLNGNVEMDADADVVDDDDDDDDEDDEDDDDEDAYYVVLEDHSGGSQRNGVTQTKRIGRPDDDDSSYQSNSEFNTSFSNISFAGDNSNGPFNYAGGIASGSAGNGGGASSSGGAGSVSGGAGVGGGGNSCSTPIRRTQTSSTKTSTPIGSFRYLRKHESNLSNLGQNEDSMNSTVAESSFFQVNEQDEDSRRRRLEKALATIDSHLTKSFVDPFSNELCRAFLTKVDFPSRSKEQAEHYSITNTNLPKLSKGQSVPLGGTLYNVEKEVGRGSYGSVFRAVNTQTGGVVAIKYQKPANSWELYICTEVKKRLKKESMLAGFMDICAAVIAPNASVLVSEFSQYGSLLDINNKIRTATTKVMHESLVMHFSSQILSIVEYLHGCNIIHADIKPDNFLLMKIPSLDLKAPTIRLIDFGCAIDMNFFEPKQQFKKVIQTDGFTCIEMQEGRPWSFQTDLFCVAGTIHVMLFGEYMQLVKKYDWDIKQKLPRYLKKHVWTEVFQKLLNIKDIDHMPSLADLRDLIDNEAYNMESELAKHIRTLSNLLKSR
uniref:Protein kinase domain-containing protein n=1 Tax=Anopheles albimanus TaxID=7167 RepID=A0A182F9E2_ANOAL